MRARRAVDLPVVRGCAARAAVPVAGSSRVSRYWISSFRTARREHRAQIHARLHRGWKAADVPPPQAPRAAPWGGAAAVARVVSEWAARPRGPRCPPMSDSGSPSEVVVRPDSGACVSSVERVSVGRVPKHGVRAGRASRDASAPPVLLGRAGDRVVALWQLRQHLAVGTSAFSGSTDSKKSSVSPSFPSEPRPSNVSTRQAEI